MTVQQISIFVGNQVGELSAITAILANEQINMRAMCVADTTDFGILRIIVDDPTKTVEVLKADGRLCSVTDVLAVVIPDTPGSLAGILAILCDNGINIEYSYAFTMTGGSDAYMVFRVQDNDAAIKVLNDNGVKLANQDMLSKNII